MTAFVNPKRYFKPGEIISIAPWQYQARRWHVIHNDNFVEFNSDSDTICLIVSTSAKLENDHYIGFFMLMPNGLSILYVDKMRDKMRLHPVVNDKIVFNGITRLS
jgi:hypothetical protein